MPLEKIADAPGAYCQHPEHNPPSHMSPAPGTYRWTCPACGQAKIFTVGVWS